MNSRQKKKTGLIMKIDFEKAYDKVHWDFLDEVMNRKGFPEVWRQWIMQTVHGVRVCININGQRSGYFRTYKGLRQGEPLSPLLFNLVADTLSSLMDKSISKGHIKGVLADLLPGGISHIQYADDTVLMIDGSDRSILTLKVILYCFEWLSGLKINYHKSEVYVFGMKQEMKERCANMLNCNLGDLPLTYLGIPISDQHLGITAFIWLPNKMNKRLDPWKGKHMSSGGRLILQTPP